MLRQSHSLPPLMATRPSCRLLSPLVSTSRPVGISCSCFKLLSLMTNPHFSIRCLAPSRGSSAACLQLHVFLSTWAQDPILCACHKHPGSPGGSPVSSHCISSRLIPCASFAAAGAGLYLLWLHRQRLLAATGIAPANPNSSAAYPPYPSLSLSLSVSSPSQLAALTGDSSASACLRYVLRPLITRVRKSRCAQWLRRAGYGSHSCHPHPALSVTYPSFHPPVTDTSCQVPRWRHQAWPILHSMLASAAPSYSCSVRGPQWEHPS